jgi:3',5'-cyclic AMP phosphodiesterase CpdA
MKLAHLSDLHFGRRISANKAEALAGDLVNEAPDLVVVSGDITDQGTIAQFRRAHSFLASLNVPFLTVPGNREIAILAVWEWLFPRFAMTRYRNYFGQPDRVFHQTSDPAIAFFGLNSVHPFPSWLGTIRRETRYWLRQKAESLAETIKVLFLHHPVLPVVRSSSFWAHGLSDAGELLNICSQTGIHLILQGHKHRSSVMELRLPERGSRIVVSACGAPLMPDWDSVYHLIEISNTKITVVPREFLEGSFHAVGHYEFSLDGEANFSSASGRRT